MDQNIVLSYSHCNPFAYVSVHFIEHWIFMFYCESKHRNSHDWKWEAKIIYQFCLCVFLFGMFALLYHQTSG